MAKKITNQERINKAAWNTADVEAITCPVCPHSAMVRVEFWNEQDGRCGRVECITCGWRESRPFEKE